MEVQFSCTELEVSRSGFYAWLNRPTSQREIANSALEQKIKEIHGESRSTYGLPRIKAKLAQDGYSCGKGRIGKIMKNAGISGITKMRFKVRTTDSNHSNPIAPRIFKTEEASSHPVRPNQVWASDISYM